MQRCISYIAITILLPILVCACHSKECDYLCLEDGDGEDLAESEGQPQDDPCPYATESLGFTACYTGLESDEQFDELSLAEEFNPAIERIGKFILPASPDADLPLVFQNVNEFLLHYDFLQQAFPEMYSGLTPEEYDRITLDPQARSYYAGTLVRFVEDCHSLRYGFSIYQNRQDYPALDISELAAIQKALAVAVPGQAPLYVPLSNADEDDYNSENNAGLLLWDCGVPLDYEIYKAGTAYGYMRIYDEATFAEAGENGAYGWQDIVAIDNAPRDIQGVTAAIITGSRQNALSHINVLASMRGTPNCYLRDLRQTLAEYEGKLVRLEADASGLRFSDDITLADAEAFWQANRPALEDVALPDYEYMELSDISEVPVAEASQRDQAFTRFGGKGANLAILDSAIDKEFMVAGLLIPFGYYDEFMQHNFIKTEIDGQAVDLSYSEYVEYWTAEEGFLSDMSLRHKVLEDLSDNMKSDSHISQKLFNRLDERIPDVFGAKDVMLRFRSSSNIEDAPLFSGAGLYESESACLADSFESAYSGSVCDDDALGPRLIEDALREVWASFWTPRAFEERFYFQFYEPSKTAMAIAITPAFLDETVSGVVFSGLPQILGDDRLLVNSQIGDVSVVSPPDGVLSEVAIIDADGASIDVTRTCASTLLRPPAVVMSDGEYIQLASVVQDVASTFPLDLQGYLEDELVLDMEFKLDAERKLWFKQARPFLRKGAQPAADAFILTVSSDAELCGRFEMYRDVFDEYELLTYIKPLAGKIELPLAGDLPQAGIFDEILFGPDAQSLLPSAPAEWEREVSTSESGKTYYRFRFKQDLAGEGVTGSVSWYVEGYSGADGILHPAGFVLDEDSIGMEKNRWAMTIEKGGLEYAVNLSSCQYADLPIYRRKVKLAGGDEMTLDVRIRPKNLATSLASLMRAEWRSGNEVEIVEDYFKLVYAADRHNWRERLMFVLPESKAGVSAYLFEEPYPFEASGVVAYPLDEDLERLPAVEVESYEIEILGE